MNNIRRIIVVGATSGLGYGLAEKYISDGYIVGLVGRRETILKDMSEGKDNVFFQSADVTHIDTIGELLQHLTECMGGMDRLVLCSGVGRMNPSLDYALELPTIDTNVRGWTVVVDWAFNYFMRQGFGHIAAISSVAGLRGLSPAPAYAASKSYQIHYLDSLRQRADIAKVPVHVTDVRPGFVRTPLLSVPEKLFWVDEPEKAITAIYKVINTQKRRAVVTKRWAFLAPLMRIAPDWIVEAILSRA